MYSKYSPKLRSKRDEVEKEIKQTTTAILVGVITIICCIVGAIVFKSVELVFVGSFLIACWVGLWLKLISHLIERDML